VAMALLGFGVWSMVVQLLVMSSTSALILWASSDWRPSMQFSRSHFKALFQYGIQIAGSRILSYTNSQLPDFLIGYFMGATSLGYFSLAHTFTKRLVNTLRNVILDVAYPAFSQYQHQPDTLRTLFHQASRFTALLVFPFYAIIFLLAQELVFVLFGPEWIPAIPLTRILALMGGIYALVAYFSQILMAIGETKTLLRIKLVLLVINAIGLLVSIQYDLNLVAAAYVASWYIIMPLYYYYVHKKINLEGYLANLTGATLGVFIMCSVMMLVRFFIIDQASKLVVLLTCTLLGCVSYVITLLIVAPETMGQALSATKLIIPRISNRSIKTEDDLE
ncbi:MAG: oligosaccharide flippase family protein, partial [Anaerolineae bacterium]|nr:oligosaccharide flippase family protein [Anaerolineae bacterium]